MTYFKILSIALGGWMVLGGLWAAFFPGAWKNMVVRTCPERRPGWLLWVSVCFGGLILWTWYQFLILASAYAFVVTFVVSLTLLKIVPVVFFYGKFRDMVFGLMNEPVALRMVMLSSSAIGLALLTMGIFF